jgi:hypothetical protein
MTLLTVATLRAQVQTGMDDTQLAALIEREEAEVIARYGAHYVDGVTPITEECTGDSCSVYLKRRVSSISSITEARQLGGTATTLTTSQYHVWPGQGRLGRLPEGTRWGRTVTVSYVPADDSPLRIQVLIELCRLALEQTAMKGESVAGEYSYQASDWVRERQRLYRRLEFPSI